MPPTKKRFQASFRQSYFRNGIPDGATAAHRCLKDEEIPKDLFPMSSKRGTVRPIKGPEMYQGQGLDNRSIMTFKLWVSNERGSTPYRTQFQSGKFQEIT